MSIPNIKWTGRLISNEDKSFSQDVLLAYSIDQRTPDFVFSDYGKLLSYLKIKTKKYTQFIARFSYKNNYVSYLCTVHGDFFDVKPIAYKREIVSNYVYASDVVFKIESADDQKFLTASGSELCVIPTQNRNKEPFFIVMLYPSNKISHEKHTRIYIIYTEEEDINSIVEYQEDGGNYRDIFLRFSQNPIAGAYDFYEDVYKNAKNIFPCLIKLPIVWSNSDASELKIHNHKYISNAIVLSIHNVNNYYLETHHDLLYCKNNVIDYSDNNIVLIHGQNADNAYILSCNHVVKNVIYDYYFQTKFIQDSETGSLRNAYRFLFKIHDMNEFNHSVSVLSVFYAYVHTCSDPFNLNSCSQRGFADFYALYANIEFIPLFRLEDDVLVNRIIAISYLIPLNEARHPVYSNTHYPIIMKKSYFSLGIVQNRKEALILDHDWQRRHR